jgi:hypothetical protein
VFLVFVAGQVAATFEGLRGGAGVADVIAEGDWVVCVGSVASFPTEPTLPSLKCLLRLKPLAGVSNCGKKKNLPTPSGSTSI